MLVCSSGVLEVESGLRLRTVGFGRRAVLDGRPDCAAEVEEGVPPSPNPLIDSLIPLGPRVWAV